MKLKFFVQIGTVDLGFTSVADLGGALKRPRRAHVYRGPTLAIKKSEQGVKKLFFLNIRKIIVTNLTLTCTVVDEIKGIFSHF